MGLLGIVWSVSELLLWPQEGLWRKRMGGRGFCLDYFGSLAGCLSLFGAGIRGGLLPGRLKQMGIGSGKRKIGLRWGFGLKIHLRLIVLRFFLHMGLLIEG
jgi:hypothetical protein